MKHLIIITALLLAPLGALPARDLLNFRFIVVG